MKKKIFAVSDVHGHYTQLMEALEAAEFDAEDEQHLFVSCGDLLDRGPENAEVYAFVRGLQRKILIKGNHEDYLSALLKQGGITDTEIHNGTHLTIIQMLGENAVDENGCIERETHGDKIREVTAFLDSMQDYYEAGDYVFTHGWLPITFEGNRPKVSPLWREESPEEWYLAHTLEWQQLYSVNAVLAGKTIVCGHRPARMGDQFDPMREPDCSEPFYGKGMITIDAGTKDSGRVNVLVIEIEE